MLNSNLRRRSIILNFFGFAFLHIIVHSDILLKIILLIVIRVIQLLLVLLIAIAPTSAPLTRRPLSLACMLLHTGQLLLSLADGHRALFVLQDLVL